MLGSEQITSPPQSARSAPARPRGRVVARVATGRSRCRSAGAATRSASSRLRSRACGTRRTIERPPQNPGARRCSVVFSYFRAGSLVVRPESTGWPRRVARASLRTCRHAAVCLPSRSSIPGSAGRSSSARPRPPHPRSERCAAARTLADATCRGTAPPSSPIRIDRRGAM